MQLKVSLIINIHNSSKFIKNISNTINSLANKVEVIVIDDYSTDDSHQRILDNTKNSIYKFIRLKKESGISIARNTGIQNATKKFITFMDHDDILNINEFVKACIKVNTIAGSSLIVFPYQTSFYKGGKVIKDKLKSQERTITLKELNNIKQRFSTFTLSRETYHICLSAWSKFYSREILQSKSLRFKEGMNKFEDCSFGLSYLYNVHKIYIFKNNFYTYSQARNIPSGLSNNYDIKEWLKWINQFKNELAFQNINSKNISIQFLSILLYGTIIRFLNNCNFSMIDNLIFELNNSKIDYKNLLNLHVKPPGADLFLTFLLRNRIFFIAWIYCKFKNIFKSKKYKPPFWCISEKVHEL